MPPGRRDFLSNSYIFCFANPAHGLPRGLNISRVINAKLLLLWSPDLVRDAGWKAGHATRPMTPESSGRNPISISLLESGIHPESDVGIRMCMRLCRCSHGAEHQPSFVRQYCIDF